MEGVEWNSEILDRMWKYINLHSFSLYVEGKGAAHWVRTATVLAAIDRAAEDFKEFMEGKQNEN